MPKRGITPPRKRFLTGSGTRGSWTEIYETEPVQATQDSDLDEGSAEKESLLLTLQERYRHIRPTSFKTRTPLEQGLRELLNQETP